MSVSLAQFHRAPVSLEALEDNLLIDSSSLLSYIPGLMALYSIFKTSGVTSSNLFASTVTLPSVFSFIKKLVMTFRTHPDNPGQSPHLKILN